jgi:hypothetical protein
MIDDTMARRFMRIALGHVGQEYPHKLDHVMAGDADVLPPRQLHPIFHGSFDFHSCVHSWWTLLTCARMHPGTAEAQDVAARALALFTPDNVAAECAYALRPESAGFVRPYGWAWVLALHGEALAHPQLGERLAPLAGVFAERFRAHLPKLTYPIRTGTHFNTAFGCLLALRWADAQDAALAALIRARAVDWFGSDRDCQAWEPEGDAFLSPALTEAMLMQAVLGDGFGAWMADFLPRLAAGEPATLFQPAVVSDRTDGKIAHLDGLNLSRAWAWATLAPSLPALDAKGVAATHRAAAMPHLDVDYMGTHWLSTYALLALSAEADHSGADHDGDGDRHRHPEQPAPGTEGRAGG